MPVRRPLPFRPRLPRAWRAKTQCGWIGSQQEPRRIPRLPRAWNAPKTHGAAKERPEVKSWVKCTPGESQGSVLPMGTEPRSDDRCRRHPACEGRGAPKEEVGRPRPSPPRRKRMGRQKNVQRSNARQANPRGPTVLPMCTEPRSEDRCRRHPASEGRSPSVLPMGTEPRSDDRRRRHAACEGRGAPKEGVRGPKAKTSQMEHRRIPTEGVEPPIPRSGVGCLVH